MTKPILMSAENPSGMKLEDLLSQVQQELLAKTNKIADSTVPTAIEVKGRNYKILAHLQSAEVLQRESYTKLAELGPDTGPTGTPRI